MNVSVLCFEMKAQSSESTKDSNFYFISPSIKLNKWLEKGIDKQCERFKNLSSLKAYKAFHRQPNLKPS